MALYPEGALIADGGPSKGQVVNLPMGVTTFGRMPFQRIVVDDPSVSRQHAVIWGT